jgi:hypothetical protein
MPPRLAAAGADDCSNELPPDSIPCELRASLYALFLPWAFTQLHPFMRSKTKKQKSKM